MRKLPLMAAAVMFIATQAAVAAPANRRQASAQGHGRDANHLGEEEKAPQEK